MLNRLPVTLGIVYIGLHVIGAGIVFSGADVPWNLVWPPLSALFSFETAILTGLIRAITLALATAAVLAIAYGAFLVLALILTWVDSFKAWRAASPKRTHAEELRGCPNEHLPSLEMKELPKEVPPVPKPQPQSFPTPKAQAPLPTAQEIKQKAIEQILRGY